MDAAEKNIKTVVRLEQEIQDSGTLAERVGDVIGGFSGTMLFVVLHVIGFGLWFLLNSHFVPASWHFDSYPFVLLQTVVSIEAVFLSSFVLIKQNRMSKIADRRDHLTLQVDLLTESEVTKVLQIQRQICNHLGIQCADAETKELSKPTSVDALARELHRHLPETE